MDFNEVTYDNATPFDSYGPGFFRLGGRIHEGNLVVVATAVRSWTGHDDAGAILAFAGDIDVVLMGTGETLAQIPRELRAALEGAGIGVELMSTPSACRTYNVLLGEGRRVAAAVLAL